MTRVLIAEDEALLAAEIREELLRQPHKVHRTLCARAQPPEGLRQCLRAAGRH